ncbi:MAG: CopD family protein [Flavobacteriales bacterium]
MPYLILKSLHIIFVVTWFAGLFYMFRLFVYHAEAARKPDPDRGILLAQYAIMERRLWYIITWPSAILTLISGFWLLIQMPAYLSQPWMHLKLFFIACLLAYQLYGQKVFNRIRVLPSAFTSFRMRLWNEAGTLLLVAIVFLVVNRDSISWIWGALGLLGLGAIMTLAAQAYRKKRARSGEESV